MSEPDVVAELDRWIAAGYFVSNERAVVQRARAEIVALRETLAGGNEHEPEDTRHVRTFRERLRQTRAEALEEAARACDAIARLYGLGPRWSAAGLQCAETIRALLHTTHCLSHSVSHWQHEICKGCREDAALLFETFGRQDPTPGRPDYDACAAALRALKEQS